MVLNINTTIISGVSNTWMLGFNNNMFPHSSLSPDMVRRYYSFVSPDCLLTITFKKTVFEDYDYHTILGSHVFCSIRPKPNGCLVDITYSHIAHAQLRPASRSATYPFNHPDHSTKIKKDCGWLTKHNPWLFLTQKPCPLISLIARLSLRPFITLPCDTMQPAYLLYDHPPCVYLSGPSC